ncbi:MAG: hypothetical protein ACM3ZV_13295 [Bacillota bacterium]
MLQWLLMAAAAPALSAHGVHAPVGLRMHAPPADAVERHSPDLTLPHIVPPPSRPLVVDGMIVHDSVGPNAMLGLGIAGVRRGGPDLRTGQRSRRSHRPSVNFVLKF